MNNHEAIRKIIDEAGSKLVSVRFIKKDGTERQLTWNPQHVGEIKGTGTKCADPNIFRVMDIKLGQWRSFDARRCISIKCDGHQTQLTQEAQ